MASGLAAALTPCAHLHGRPSCSTRITRHSPLHLRGEHSSSASTKGRRCLRRAGRSCNRSCLGWRVQVSLCSTNIKKLGMGMAHANASSTTTSPAAAASSSATRTSASIVVHQLPHGITSFPSQRADAPCGTTSSLVASRAMLERVIDFSLRPACGSSGSPSRSRSRRRGYACRGGYRTRSATPIAMTTRSGASTSSV